MNNLSGPWLSVYEYTSTSRGGETHTSEHTMNAVQVGKRVILESIPDASGSQVDIELLLDGATASGTWQERTSPDGYYKGKVFDGEMALHVSDDGRQMTGEWTGAGSNGHIHCGRWEFVRPE